MAVKSIVIDRLSIARTAANLGVGWNTASDAILAAATDWLFTDPQRLDGVTTVGVDEHVVRHEALLFRMEVRDLHRFAVVAAG